MTHASHHRWTDLPIDRPMPLLARRRVIGEQVMVSQVTLEAGCFVASHAHANEQIAMIMEGELEFVVGVDGSPDCRSVRVKAGELLLLPSNVPHSARAIERSVVLDIFAPPSERTGIDELGERTQ